MQTLNPKCVCTHDSTKIQRRMVWAISGCPLFHVVSLQETFRLHQRKQRRRKQSQSILSSSASASTSASASASAVCLLFCLCSTGVMAMLSSVSATAFPPRFDLAGNLQLEKKPFAGYLFNGKTLNFSSNTTVKRIQCTTTQPNVTTPLNNASTTKSDDDDIGFVGIHHVGILCENLERSLEFYCGLLGLETCNARPNDRLRYRGTWLWVGDQMIHLMELPNPDPVTGRPVHGGEDRHICVSVKNPMRLKSVLENAGIPYTMSKSGRPVIFTRDPDGNALECQPSYMHDALKK